MGLAGSGTGVRSRRVDSIEGGRKERCDGVMDQGVVEEETEKGG